MYYTDIQIKEALDKAKEVMNGRSGSLLGHKYGYNDCWTFVIEYDKFLRGNSELPSLDIKYKNHLDFEEQIEKTGHISLPDFIKNYKYEHVKNKRPRYGDVAYELTRDGSGTAMIADRKWWRTAKGTQGIVRGRLVKFYELAPILIARPLRS